MTEFVAMNAPSQTASYYGPSGAQYQAVNGVASIARPDVPGAIAAGWYQNPPATLANKQLLAKMRASIAAATNNNPTVNQPWLPPQAVIGGSAGAAVWAANTVYPGGTVLTNAAGTHQFLCWIGGTSGATQPSGMTTPVSTTFTSPNPDNYGTITDNTCAWQWMGPTRTTSALAGAPAFSVGSLPSQLTQSWPFGPTTPNGVVYNTFRFTGGSGAAMQYNSPYTAAVLRGVSTTAGQGSNLFQGNYVVANLDAYVEFVTDAPLIAFDTYNNGGYLYGQASQPPGMAFVIDGRRLWDGNVCCNVSVANGYVILDWRNTGGRKFRKIRVSVGGGLQTYAPFWTTPQDTVYFPGNSQRWSMAFVGDSLWTGQNSGPVVSFQGRANQVCDLLGCDSHFNASQGSTGMFATNSGAYYNYQQRIQDVINFNPDVVWVQGSINDGITLYLQQQYTTGYLAYLQSLRAALPNAMIFLSGVLGTTPSQHTVAEQWMFNAFTQFNDSNSYWVPCTNDPVAPWWQGTGYITAVQATGNSSIYVGPNDGVHPSWMGIGYLASRQAEAMKNIIQTLSLSV